MDSSRKGSATLPRNKYTEIRPQKPSTKEEAVRAEFKTCKYTTEVIVSDGINKGELRKVYTEPTCQGHHPMPPAEVNAQVGPRCLVVVDRASAATYAN